MLNDRKSYAGSSLAPGSLSHVRQVKGQGSDKESHKPAVLWVDWRQSRDRKANLLSSG